MKTLITLSLAVLSIFAIAQKRTDKTIAALSKMAVPLKTTNPDSTYSDLLFLKDLIKDHKIVAMGEATHGTREFFEMKDRTFRFLVQEMGFRVFAIEASLAECRVVNDYVMYGTGDLQKAIDTMYFWVWNTQEVKNMISWMRQFNSDRMDNDKIRFVGFDMQHTRQLALNLIGFLKTYHPNDHRFEAFMDSINISGYNTKYTEENIRRKYATLPELKQLIIDSKEVIIQRDNIELYTALMQDIAVLNQHYIDDLNSASDNHKSKHAFGSIRDSCMAANVKMLIKDLPQKSKIFIWAHNGHVTQQPSKMYNTQGYWLSEWFGEDYYVIGFDFNRGSFVARNSFRLAAGATAPLEIQKVGLADKDWTGNTFSKTGIRRFFLDLKAASNDPAISSLVNKKSTSRSIGWMFWPTIEKRYVTTSKLAEAYDALIFIENTNFAVPNYPKALTE